MYPAFGGFAPEPGFGCVQAVLVEVDEGDADVGGEVGVAEVVARSDADVEKFFADVLLEEGEEVVDYFAAPGVSADFSERPEVVEFEEVAGVYGRTLFGPFDLLFF